MDARLRAALTRGSQVQLDEIGVNLSRRDLLGAVRATDRELALAGIAAARTAPDGWQLLSVLAERAGGADRPLAGAATEAGWEIVGELDAETVTQLEIVEYELAEHHAAWRTVAMTSGGYADVRVRALELLTALTRWRSEDVPYPLALALADPEPAFRRAALELWSRPLDSARRALVADVLDDDDDPNVALAAAQLLCARPDRNPVPGTAHTPALGGRGRARLVALFTVEPPAQLPPASTLAAARCLAADADDQSRAALRALAQRGPASVRESLRKLVDNP